MQNWNEELGLMQNWDEELLGLILNWDSKLEIGIDAEMG